MSVRALEANAPAEWDRLWAKAETRDWRATALGPVYDRIAELVGTRPVVDVGGGVGALAGRLLEAGSRRVEVWDHSESALSQVPQGVAWCKVDVEDTTRPLPPVGRQSVIVATEFLEHLTYDTQGHLLEIARDQPAAIFSVPNNRLGPDEEPQHTIKWTALEFLTLLREWWGEDCRVEVMGGFLLGVCGELARKTTRLSVCLPVRDEEADLGRTLASFRGVADEIVVGVDPRSKDRTWDVASEYADVVFELSDPACQNAQQLLHDPAVPPEGVHFAWVRNQCMDRCSHPWIFMTEGHEHLGGGERILRHLDQAIPAEVDVVYVTRTGQGQRWSFPWLCRNKPELRYKRSTHNVLDVPAGQAAAKAPAIVTVHDRDHANAVQRSGQRRAQNRATLWDDWEIRGNATSLFYFAQELRADDQEGAIDRFREFLESTHPQNHGAMRYQARLILSGLLVRSAAESRASVSADDPLRIFVEDVASHRLGEAADVLHGCTADDWDRTDHWLRLGDLAYHAGQLEKAYRFYSYSGATFGRIPFTVWWINDADYGWLPAQRLAMTCGALGKFEEALVWAERVVSSLPENAPDVAREEAECNVESIQAAIAERSGKIAPSDEGASI